MNKNYLKKPILQEKRESSPFTLRWNRILSSPSGKKKSIISFQKENEKKLSYDLNNGRQIALKGKYSPQNSVNYNKIKTEIQETTKRRK